MFSKQYFRPLTVLLLLASATAWWYAAPSRAAEDAVSAPASAATDEMLQQQALQDAQREATASEGPSFEEQRAAFERRRQFGLQVSNQVRKEQKRPAATGIGASFGGNSGNVASQYNAIVNAKVRSVPAPLTRRYNYYGYYGRW